MIVLCGGTKGGVGKSTVATNLAIARAKEGFDVLLIDADNQETSADFTSLRTQELGEAGYVCIKLNGAAVHTEGKKLAKKYDDVIIDAGGRDTASQRASLIIADVVLIPFVPRSFDVWTLEPVSQMVAEARIINSGLNAYAFINRADSTGSENEDASNYIKETKELKFLDSPIGNRKAFGRASAQGLSVLEVKPKDSKAIAEFQNLYNHIFKAKVVK